MVDEKEGGAAASAVEADKKGVLDSAVDKVREQNEDKVPFKVLEEENPSGARRKVKVEVDQAEWDKRLNELFKNVRQQASLPGFRKGKAPLQLLQKKYRDAAVNELVEKISPLIVRDYEQDKSLVIYGTPVITDYSAEQGQPATITLEMEIKPEITPDKYRGIEVEVPENKLPEDALENQLNELREQNATYSDVEREYQEGDGLNIDYKITNAEGKTLQHRSAQPVDNPAAALPAEVKEALAGKKAGDRVDVDVSGLKYSITVRAVREKKVPEINDDFAKDLGYADASELRSKTEDKLKKSVAEMNADEAFEALTLKLVESHQFDIPQALKMHVQKEMADSDMNYFRSTGYRPPRLQNISEADEYSRVLDQDAVQRVKGFLLIDAIGKKENIVAEEADINKSLESLAEEQGRKPVGVRANLERNRQWDRFLEQVRFEKIREFLLKENQIKYVERKEEEAKAEEAKSDEASEANAEGAAEVSAEAAPKKTTRKKKEDTAE